MKNTVQHFLIFICLLLVAGCSLGGEEKVAEDFKGDIPISKMGQAEVAALPEGSQSKTTPMPAKTAPADTRKVEGSASEIEGHPKIDPNQRSTQRQIVIPSATQGKWKSVKIFVRNKKDEEQSQMKTVELGSSFMLDEGNMMVSVGPFLPNFVMDGKSYTSKGNELVNPAVRLVVEDKGKTIFEGWAFAKYPEMYAFQHEVFGLQLMDFTPAEVS